MARKKNVVWGLVGEVVLNQICFTLEHSNIHWKRQFDFRHDRRVEVLGAQTTSRKTLLSTSADDATTIPGSRMETGT